MRFRIGIWNTEKEKEEEMKKEKSRHPKLVAVHYIQLTVFPVLLLQGILGNALAIPTLVSLGRSAWSTLLYLALLGVTDLIVLFSRCGDAWYMRITGTSLSEQMIDASDAVCRTYHFAFAFVTHINRWLMVAAAVEMMIATKWPGQTHKACTRERARYVITLLTLILICLDINHFWTHGVPKRPRYGCGYIEGFSTNFRDWIWPALDNSVTLALPLLAVSICFLVTAITLINRPADREEELRTIMRKYFLELPALIDFRHVLFVLSLLFLVQSTFETTVSVIMLLVAKGYLVIDDCESQIDMERTLGLLKTIEITLMFFLCSTKIYLYVGLSPSFRARLWKGLGKMGCKMTRLCTFPCDKHRWTLVARDDENTRRRSTASSKHATGQITTEGEDYLQTEPRTTLGDSYEPGSAARGFSEPGNGTAFGNRPGTAAQGNHLGDGLDMPPDNMYGFIEPSPNAAASHCNGPSMPPPFIHDNCSYPSYSANSRGEDYMRRNGAVGGSGAPDSRAAPKPPHNRPYLYVPERPRVPSRGDDSSIALNTNSNRPAGFTQGNGRGLSFGDHLV
ncbi:FMRFamide receptor [Plakobranchus ocellatus]|uniref:FMRFamide receptor n=1 Tax=Plakobranchus ocellatus TaxID=259542 RepID=A0AAV4CAY3_9GAST|nr:FMRFamide receptor [Plakobranchus ocellatus]